MSIYNILQQTYTLAVIKPHVKEKQTKKNTKIFLSFQLCISVCKFNPQNVNFSVYRLYDRTTCFTTIISSCVRFPASEEEECMLFFFVNINCYINDTGLRMKEQEGTVPMYRYNCKWNLKNHQVFLYQTFQKDSWFAIFFSSTYFFF